MKVQFVGFTNPDGPVAKLFEKAVLFCAKQSSFDHSNVTLEFYLLADISVNTSTTQASPDGDEAITGAVFFPEADYDTDHMTTFKLGINHRLTPGEIFEVICHEMVHIEQYVSKRLRTIREGELMGNFWYGEFVSTTDVGYFDLPWEKEAYTVQDDLLGALIEDEEFMGMAMALAQG